MGAEKQFIDACVFLGALEKGEDQYKNRLNIVGYKQKPVGVISHNVLGEIFCSIFLKIQDYYARDDALVAINRVLGGMVSDKRLEIARIRHDENKYFDEIQELGTHTVPEDDCYHLSAAIVYRCRYFITRDSKLLNKAFSNAVRERFKINIESV